MNTPPQDQFSQANPTPEQAANIIRSEQTIYVGQPALLKGIGSLLICVLTLGLALIYFWVRRNGISYKITNQRIVIDRGVFSKRLDQVDLYRVNDFEVERPFSQRIVGTGNIRMQTHDKIHPEIVLEGLHTDVVQLYETIRAAVEAAKQAKGVRVMDFEDR